MSEKKRAPNFSTNEKTVLLNIIYRFKHIIENKQTNSQTWREKDEAWTKITEYFNSQSPEIPRNKESLKKFYDNIKKNIRKEVAEDKKEITKTGGGPAEIKAVNPVKMLALGLMNEKTVYGLNNNFDNDACFPVNGSNSNSQNISSDLPSKNNSEDDNYRDVEQEQLAGTEIHLDHSYDKQPILTAVPSMSHHQSLNQAQTVYSKKKTSTCFKDQWTRRRRPAAVQQLTSSQLQEEYVQLAKIKKQCFEAEKENIIWRKGRDKEIFDLEKEKLMLEIQLKKYELQKYENKN